MREVPATMSKSAFSISFIASKKESFETDSGASSQEAAARKDALKKGAVSTTELDVTDYRIIKSEFELPDVFYSVPTVPAGADIDVYLELWIDRIISDNREDLRVLMSQDYLIRCYEVGTREPWVEYRVRDRFGNEVWLGQKMILTKNESTGHIMCLSVIRNITDQVATRAENERRMSMIEGLSAEYSSVYFVDVQKDKYYIYRLADRIRKRFEKGFCESFEDSIKYFLENGVHSFDRDNVRENLLLEGIRKNLVSRRDYSFLFRALTSEGPKYYRCMVVRIDKKEGEATEALVGFADVHEEQENSMRQRQLLESALEQARNAGKAKTMFLSNMSHDIRTPMNAIMGFAELAKLHPDDVETVEDSLNKILTSGEHLLKLINNVLDLSRIESGRMILKEEPCSLRQEINEAMNIFRSQMKVRNIEYVQYIADDVEDLIFCDTLKMKQVIINIVSNSVKYTHPGGKIELRIENAEAPEGYAGIFLRVRDTGIGMSPEFIKKIYEPFEREESSAISQVVGSGLGMPICKAIVDAMGGNITVSSEQNKGTEINVHLEFRLQNSDIREELNADAFEHARYRIFNRPEYKSISKKKFRILLVEDNRMNREIAGKMLKHLGHETIMCENGDKAVELMRDAGDEDYDLILMDVHMPGMSGYEATEKIRSAGGMKTWVPIVAMTADAFESDVQHAYRSGMNAFISKPVNLKTLQTVIERFIGKPGLSDEDDRIKAGDVDGLAKPGDGGDCAKTGADGKAGPDDGGDR